MRSLLQFILTLALCGWLWCGHLAASWAAVTPTLTPPASALEPPLQPSYGLTSSNITSEKVSQFVAACLKVVALIERREGELQGAETESESLRIQQDIEAEAIAIIEATGLTRPEYLQLLGLANVDPEFGERIVALLQEGAA